MEIRTPLQQLNLNSQRPYEPPQPRPAPKQYIKPPSGRPPAPLTQPPQHFLLSPQRPLHGAGDAASERLEYSFSEDEDEEVDEDSFSSSRISSRAISLYRCLVLGQAAEITKLRTRLMFVKWKAATAINSASCYISIRQSRVPPLAQSSSEEYPIPFKFGATPTSTSTSTSSSTSASNSVSHPSFNVTKPNPAHAGKASTIASPATFSTNQSSFSPAIFGVVTGKDGPGDRASSVSKTDRDDLVQRLSSSSSSTASSSRSVLEPEAKAPPSSLGPSLPITTPKKRRLVGENDGESSPDETRSTNGPHDSYHSRLVPTPSRGAAATPVRPHVHTNLTSTKSALKSGTPAHSSVEDMRASGRHMQFGFASQDSSATPVRSASKTLFSMHESDLPSAPPPPSTPPRTVKSSAKSLTQQRVVEELTSSPGPTTSPPSSRSWSDQVRSSSLHAGPSSSLADPIGVDEAAAVSAAMATIAAATASRKASESSTSPRNTPARNKPSIRPSSSPSSTSTGASTSTSPLAQSSRQGQRGMSELEERLRSLEDSVKRLMVPSNPAPTPSPVSSTSTTPSTTAEGTPDSGSETMPHSNSNSSPTSTPAFVANSNSAPTTSSTSTSTSSSTSASCLSSATSSSHDTIPVSPSPSHSEKSLPSYSTPAPTSMASSVCTDNSSSTAGRSPVTDSSASSTPSSQYSTPSSASRPTNLWQPLENEFQAFHEAVSSATKLSQQLMLRRVYSEGSGCESMIDAEKTLNALIAATPSKHTQYTTPSSGNSGYSSISRSRDSSIINPRRSSRGNGGGSGGGGAADTGRGLTSAGSSLSDRYTSLQGVVDLTSGDRIDMPASMRPLSSLGSQGSGRPKVALNELPLLQDKIASWKQRYTTTTTVSSSSNSRPST